MLIVVRLFGNYGSSSVLDDCKPCPPRFHFVEQIGLVLKYSRHLSLSVMDLFSMSYSELILTKCFLIFEK